MRLEEFPNRYTLVTLCYSRVSDQSEVKYQYLLLNANLILESTGNNNARTIVPSSFEFSFSFSLPTIFNIYYIRTRLDFPAFYYPYRSESGFSSTTQIFFITIMVNGRPFQSPTRMYVHSISHPLFIPPDIFNGGRNICFKASRNEKIV